MVNAQQNEMKAISFLARHFTEKYSINQLSRHINMTPKGAHKLLKRLEQEEIIYPEKLGNAIFYNLNLSSDYARRKVELSLFNGIKLPYARAQAKDFERLRPFAQAAILFGSVLSKGENAGDIDILVIVDKAKYGLFHDALNKLQQIKPKPIQPVIQAPGDFAKNLKKLDPVILEILRTGKVLWGHDVVVDAIKKVMEK